MITKELKLQFHKKIKKITLCTNSLSSFVSKSDRADQPFNLDGAREGQGQHFKKNRQSTARKDEKRDNAGAARAHQARAPLQWSTGAVPVGVPALAQAATVGLLHSPGLGERKAEKKMTEKMYVNAPRLQAQCRPCTPQCTPMQGPALPMRRECKRRLY